MVCPDCIDQKHEKCRGETWCDCQHRVPRREEVPSDPGAGDSPEAA